MKITEQDIENYVETKKKKLVKPKIK